MRQVDSYELWFSFKFDLTRVPASTWRDMRVKDAGKRARAVASAADRLMDRAGRWMFFAYEGAAAREVDPDRVKAQLVAVLSNVTPPTAAGMSTNMRGNVASGIADLIVAQLAHLEVLVQEPSKSSAGVSSQTQWAQWAD